MITFFDIEEKCKQNNALNGKIILLKGDSLYDNNSRRR